jgi:hypothetical protein
VGAEEADHCFVHPAVKSNAIALVFGAPARLIVKKDLPVGAALAA